MLYELVSRADTSGEWYYSYRPSIAAGVVFVVLFSLLSILHLAVTVKSRVWWTVVIVLGGFCEMLGWVGRLWSYRNPASFDGFLMQTILLVIAPCFYSAACYSVTGVLIRRVGPEHSLLSPKSFLYVFCTVDLISLVIQSVGGAMASNDNPDTSLNGTHIMVAGIVFQLVAMIVYAAIALHFYVRARSALVSEAAGSARFAPVAGVALLAAPRVKALVWGVALASLAIIIRGIYRTVELAQGWHGWVIEREVFTLVLDAVPMVLCMAFLVPAHPYFGLPNRGKTTEAGGARSRTTPPSRRWFRPTTSPPSRASEGLHADRPARRNTSFCRAKSSVRGLAFATENPFRCA